MTLTQNNMDKTVIAKLEDLGLSRKEALLYLALLALDEAPVQVIAKTAKLERSTAYVLLESLEKKGFAERAGNEVLHYRACEPSELLRTADTAVAEAKQINDSMQTIAKELESVVAGPDLALRATYFDTAEGLATLRREVESGSGSDVRALLHDTSSVGTLDTKRAHSRFIIATGKTTRDVHSKTFSEQVRAIPRDRYPFTSDLFIFGNTLAVLSDAEEFAIRIESSDFTAVVTEAFELAWEEAARLDTESRPKKSRGTEKHAR